MSVAKTGRLECLVFEGLCNRINCLASALTTKRAIRLLWAVNSSCPARFEQLFEPIEHVDVINEEADAYEYSIAEDRLCWCYPRNLANLPRGEFRDRLYGAYRRILDSARVSSWAQPATPALGVHYRHHSGNVGKLDPFLTNLRSVTEHLAPHCIHVASDSREAKQRILAFVGDICGKITVNATPSMSFDLDRSLQDVRGMIQELLSLRECNLGVLTNSSRSTITDPLRGYGVQAYYTFDDGEHRRNGRSDDLYEKIAVDRLLQTEPQPISDRLGFLGNGSRSLAAPPTTEALIDSCPFRKRIRQCDGEEIATCGLLAEVTRLTESSSLCDVKRDECSECCRDREPSPTHISMTLARLLRKIADSVVLRDGTEECSMEAALDIRSLVRRQLRYVSRKNEGFEAYLTSLRTVGDGRECAHFSEQIAISQSGSMAVHRCSHAAHETTTIEQCRTCVDWRDRNATETPVTLKESVPPRKRRYGAMIQRWAVGVITSPRPQSTVNDCLDSVRRAGWSSPHIFMDSKVPLARRHEHLPISLRPDRLGAWPNHFLSITELLMCYPQAEAYLLVQDDAILYSQENLPKYLASVLWPSKSVGAISLYCSSAYARKKAGWFKFKGHWRWGALAFIFSRESARRFVSDSNVLGYRWSQHLNGRAGVDVVIGQWAKSNELDIFHPSPSLVQHIGNVSTIWPGAVAQGARRAGQFVGDMRRSLDSS